MSNFVGLCHFCDHHGPTVVMLTQPLRQDNGLVNWRTADQCSREAADPSCQLLSSRTDDPSCHQADPSCQLFLCDESVPEPYPAPDCTLYGGTRLLSCRWDCSGCSGCWSLGPARGAVFSTPGDNTTSYVSTQSGLGSVSRLARDTAVRSISCEVVPNRTGSLLFTNNPAVTTLSETFLLKDSMARGFQRYFSVVVGNQQRGNLIRSWTHLSQRVKALIDVLCTKCEETYKIETKGSSGKDMKEKQFLKRRQGERSEPTRNLSELAADPTLFLLIHQHFSGILHAMENGRGEAAVAGQPVKSSLGLDESRIFPLLDIFSGLAACDRRALLYVLLAGRPLEIRSPARETGRLVAHALSLVLPNNKARDATYFANVVLTSTDGGEVSNSLVLEPGDAAKFAFRSRVCSCRPDGGISSYDGSCRSRTTSSCAQCQQADSSVAVGRLLSVVSCGELNSCTVHTRILSTVQGILYHAKVWARLRHVAEKKNFLWKLGFGAGDGEILNFFQMFLG